MHENITWAVATVLWWTALAWLLDWFWLNEMAVIVYAVLLLLDFWFWILDAYMLDRNKVTSHTAYRGVVRKMIRLSLPFIFVLILKGAGMENTKLIVDSIISILVLTEWYSIIWHVVSIDHWKQLPEIDAFEMLCEYIANFLKKWIKDKVPEDKDLSSK